MLLKFPEMLCHGKSHKRYHSQVENARRAGSRRKRGARGPRMAAAFRQGAERSAAVPANDVGVGKCGVTPAEM